MTGQQFDLEKLRPAEHVFEPDPRNTMFVRVDRTNGTSRPIELADHHELISRYVLHAGVPSEIVLQFETARNVYLYAWFIYRFYPVAEHQCLACLELALRERLKEAERAEEIVTQEVERMMAHLKVQEITPTIISLQEELERIRQAEIEKVRRKFGPVTREQEEAWEMLTRGIINKVAHGPISELRAQAGRPDGAQAIAAIRKVFHLTEPR